MVALELAWPTERVWDLTSRQIQGYLKAIMAREGREGLRMLAAIRAQDAEPLRQAWAKAVDPEEPVLKRDDGESLAQLADVMGNVKAARKIRTRALAARLMAQRINAHAS